MSKGGGSGRGGSGRGGSGHSSLGHSSFRGGKFSRSGDIGRTSNGNNMGKKRGVGGGGIDVARKMSMEMNEQDG
jgi:hypothetical protein